MYWWQVLVYDYASSRNYVDKRMWNTLKKTTFGAFDWKLERKACSNAPIGQRYFCIIGAVVLIINVL